MKKELPIYIDRLREGEVETISETLDPKRLDIMDSEIACEGPVLVTGETYLAADFLLVVLSIHADLSLKCRICNESFHYPVALVKKEEHIPIEEITDACFDLLPLIRETLLLEIPFYPQCGGSECKNRKSIEKYFSQPNKSYNPFENL